MHGIIFIIYFLILVGYSKKYVNKYLKDNNFSLYFKYFL